MGNVERLARLPRSLQVVTAQNVRVAAALFDGAVLAIRFGVDRRLLAGAGQAPLDLRTTGTAGGGHVRRTAQRYRDSSRPRCMPREVCAYRDICRARRLPDQESLCSLAGFDAAPFACR